LVVIPQQSFSSTHTHTHTYTAYTTYDKILPGHRGFSDHVKDLLHTLIHTHTNTKHSHVNIHTHTVRTLREARNLLHACPYRTTTLLSPPPTVKPLPANSASPDIYARTRVYTYIILSSRAVPDNIIKTGYSAIRLGKKSFILLLYIYILHTRVVYRVVQKSRGRPREETDTIYIYYPRIAG